jgi:hypothetical protein
MGFIKKSFRDFSRSNQHLPNEKLNVIINGKPIPDCMVKRAEKLAGPIQPGDYWLVFTLSCFLSVALLVHAA